MPRNKAIQRKKAERSPRQDRGRPRRKVVSTSCHNHGSCPWCRGNRTIGNQRLAAKIIALLEERGESLTD